MKTTKKTTKKTTVMRDEDGVITNEKEVMTALNESSMAVLYTLFQIASSPLAEVMTKMRDYHSFSTFLEAAASNTASDFYPMFHSKKDKED